MWRCIVIIVVGGSWASLTRFGIVGCGEGMVCSSSETLLQVGDKVPEGCGLVVVADRGHCCIDVVCFFTKKNRDKK